jgi:hypothetical protein
MAVSGDISVVTTRVRRHRASAALIRVEVEVPTTEDALAVRRFAQARRRTTGKTATYDSPRKVTAIAKSLEAFMADLDDTIPTTRFDIANHPLGAGARYSGRLSVTRA